MSLRVYALMWNPQFPALRDAGIRSGLGDDMLRLGGIKMVADGAIANRTSPLHLANFDIRAQFVAIGLRCGHFFFFAVRGIRVYYDQVGSVNSNRFSL